MIVVTAAIQVLSQPFGGIRRVGIEWLPMEL